MFRFIYQVLLQPVCLTQDKFAEIVIYITGFSLIIHRKGSVIKIKMYLPSFKFYSLCQNLLERINETKLQVSSH